MAQSQPIIGTPCDVPVPRKVIFKGAKASMIRLLALLRLDEAQAQLVEQIVEEPRFLVVRLPLVFCCSMREDLDHLRGGREIRLRRLAGAGIGDDRRNARRPSWRATARSRRT